MQKKNQNRKLKFDRKTIRELNHRDLEYVAGGASGGTPHRSRAQTCCIH